MRFAPSALLFSLLSALSASSALASGYHFGTQSASAQGTANANSAEGADASVLFYNPAGMSLLKGTNVSGVLTVVQPSGHYSDQGSTTAFGLSTKGGNGGKFVNTAAAPHAYITHQYSDRLTVGFGAFVPFGSKSEYDADWAGRYNTIGTELKTIALNPSFAFKLTPKLSIGGGVTAQFIDGKLSKGADFGSGALSSIAASKIAALVQAGYSASAARTAVLTSMSSLISAVSGNAAYSGRVDVKGKDWGTGFNLGLMYQVNEHTRFGVAYRSKIDHKLEGDAKWQVKTAAANLATTLNAVQSGLGTSVQASLLARYTDSEASLGITTPESLSFSFFNQQSDRFAVMGDLTMTRHSRFSELRIDFANSLADSNTPEKWDNTLRASLGASYKWSDALTLRGGVALDQSPVTEATRTPSLPDGDRTWLSGGFNWKFDAKRSLDFALSYVHVASGKVNYYDNGGLSGSTCDASLNTSSCATIRGSYRLNSALLGLQYNQQF